jgi:hypothetical protein
MLTAAALAVPAVAAAGPATQDSVALTGGPIQAGTFTITALAVTSGPAGENPAGQMEGTVVGGALPISGPATCLAVSGNAARFNVQTVFFGIVAVQVVDDQPDTFDARPTQLAPGDCSLFEPTGQGGATSGGDLVVVDAAPPPASKEQCKNGGWRGFGFTNQGECIRAVR